MVYQSQFIGQFGSVVADKKLSDIAEIYDGVHQTPHYTDSGVRFISVEDITDIYASKKFISIEDYSKYKHVPDSGDLIMTRIGTIGMCAVVSKSEPLAYYVSVTLIKPDHSVIDSTYLKYYIESGYGQSELRMRSLLEAFPMKINLNEIGKIAIKVPALDRQRAFVSIVKQADKSKFDGFKSQFIARFGTTEQSAYPVKTLREIALSSGEYGANTPATKYNPEKGRYIRITDIDEFGNLNDDRVSPEVADNKYLLHKGDLLFARTGATVGKTYLHKTGKALYAGYLIKYQFIDTVLPEFVFAYTHSKEYYQWVELTQKVGAQPNISAKQYDGLRIVVPPFEEQKSFVGLMNQADKSKYLN